MKYFDQLTRIPFSELVRSRRFLNVLLLVFGTPATISLIGCTPTATQDTPNDQPPEEPTRTASATVTTERATPQPTETATDEPAPTSTMPAIATEVTSTIEAVATIPATDGEGVAIPMGSVAQPLVSYLIDGKVVLGVDNLQIIPQTTINGVSTSLDHVGFSIWGPQNADPDSLADQTLNDYGNGSLVVLLPNVIAEHIIDPGSLNPENFNLFDLTFIKGPENVAYDQIEVTNISYGVTEINEIDPFNWTMTIEAVTYTGEEGSQVRSVVATRQKSQAGESSTTVDTDWTAVAVVETEPAELSVLELPENQNPTVWLQGVDFGQHVGVIPTDQDSPEFLELSAAFPSIDFTKILKPAELLQQMKEFGFKPSFGGGSECTVYPYAGEGGIVADCIFAHIIGTITNEEYGYTSHVVQIALVTSDGKVHTLITQADINDGPVIKWDQEKNQPTQEVGTVGQSSNAVIINSRYIEATQGNKKQVEAIMFGADGNPETGISDEELTDLYTQTTYLNTGYFKSLGYAVKGATTTSSE